MEKELTQQEKDALGEATHIGVNTDTLYRKNDDSLSADFFGASTLTWHRSGVQNDQLDDEKYFKKL